MHGMYICTYNCTFSVWQFLCRLTTTNYLFDITNCVSGVTILLSLTVFSQVLTESMPTTSDAMPLLGKMNEIFPTQAANAGNMLAIIYDRCRLDVVHFKLVFQLHRPCVWWCV